jgi:hypothetical protein
VTALRRICFGEPKPGMAKFATVLARLDRSESYCNRVGPLEHDRVTDLPFTVPALDLGYQHPTPLAFVSAAPAANDDWGIFAEHHVQLYQQGVAAANLDPVTTEAVRLCRAIYAYPGDAPEKWDEQLTTDGVYWALKFEGQRAYVVFRGSDTPLDWIRDLAGLDPDRILEHDDFGPMWDGFLIGMEDTWTAVKPLLAHADEVVFTGHSLGAARADIAAGYALLSRGTET